MLREPKETRTMMYHQYRISRDLEIIQRNQILKLKLNEKFPSMLKQQNRSEEKISKLEYRTVEITQSRKHRKKRMKKMDRA